MQYCKQCDAQVAGVATCTGGDLVCECGWVLEAHCVEEAVPVYPELLNAAYETASAIARPAVEALRNKGSCVTLNKLHQQISVKKRKYMSSSVLYDMEQHNLEHLHLPRCILDTASDMYEMVASTEKPRGTNRTCLLPVCLYLACKAENKVSKCSVG